MSDTKPHYFEVVMNSFSEGVLNQEVIVREYANTPEELVSKQMRYTNMALPTLVGAFEQLAQQDGYVTDAPVKGPKAGKKSNGETQQPEPQFVR